MITISEDSAALLGVKFLGRRCQAEDTGYWIWRSGIIPDGPGAYATNDPFRPNQTTLQLKRWGLFCAAVPNIVRRIAGLEVPTRGSALYDGGIAAYFTGRAYGRAYFSDYEHDFDLARAKRWAEQDRSPVLLGKGYSGAELHNQGHTALLLPSGYVLQSAYGEGLNWDRAIEYEREYWGDGGVMVRARDWIDTERGRVHPAMRSL